MTASLEAEMAAAAGRVRKAHRDRLVSLGVGIPAMQSLLARNYAFGVARVQPTRDGLFDYAPDGVDAVVVPVGSVAGMIFDIDETLDLIAFQSTNPTCWWWRVGDGWGLGVDLLEDDLPVRVVADPLQWLAAGGNALCVLDWSRTSPVWPALRHGPQLTFADDSLRQRIRNALIATAPLPPLEMLNAA